MLPVSGKKKMEKRNHGNIIFLGTGSDVGKSITVTAFCRILKNRGVHVAPFKAQNMSNNSYVTIEGGEIGRAQVAQAEAAGLLPSVHMNPVLLKPTGRSGAQVVIQGHVHKNMVAQEYYAFKQMLKQAVRQSFDLLAAQYDAIVMEGAGSCAEVNLRDHDIVNFEMALQTQTPVILVADIDRGGVFAQIIGTLAIISQQERDLVAGFIINKFRGDPALFDDGIAYIEKETNKPVFGLVPFYDDIHIDPEDSMSLDAMIEKNASIENTVGDASPDFSPSKDKIRILIPRLPHVSNFTDIEALAREPEVAILWAKTPDLIQQADAVILPGSKSVIHDMAYLHETRWPEAINRFLTTEKGMVIGLCGGFQMLGRRIMDPERLEGGREHIDGLGLLDITTRLDAKKVVRHATGRDVLFNTRVKGYEIHMGQTALGPSARPFILQDNESDGAVAANRRVFGTYFHGLFDCGEFRKKFLDRLAAEKGLALDPAINRPDYWHVKEDNYNRLADHFSRYTRVEEILHLMGIA